MILTFTNYSFAGTAINYVDHANQLLGYISFPEKGSTKKHSAVLIAHDWMGLGDFQKGIADKLAKQGLIAFAVDIYGAGQNPKTANDAKILSTKYKNDRQLMRSRMQAAFEVLLKNNDVDKDKIFVIGYCFGGTAALELARNGAKLKGVVSFHGGLSSPNLADAKNITSPVLILHGADDPLVNREEVKNFKNEMEQAKVNYRFIEYPGAVHAFTNPKAGNDPKLGVAYNKDADEKSWNEFMKFLENQNH